MVGFSTFSLLRHQNRLNQQSRFVVFLLACVAAGHISRMVYLLTLLEVDFALVDQVMIELAVSIYQTKVSV
jgi:hypothetical protein